MATATVVLQSCQPVTVYPVNPGDPPLTGPMNVGVGGAPGDGSVSVTTSPPGSGPQSVPTGTPAVPVPVTGATQVVLHYQAKPGRPQTVEVSYTLP